MIKKSSYNLSLLLTGDEILSGDIIDSNSVFIARELAEAGLTVKSKVTVGDRLKSILEAISFLAETSDLVIVNGGMGATVDDVTVDAAALAAGKPLVENSFALKNLENFLNKNGLSDRSIKPEYQKFWRKQISLPEGAETFPNPAGIAVGFKIKIKDKTFYFTPGVPREMRDILTESIIPDIQMSLSPDSRKLLSSSFKVFGLGESQIQKIIDSSAFPESWDKARLGFRAATPYVEVKLSSENRQAASVLKEKEEFVARLLSHYIFSRDISLPETTANILKEKNKKLGLAESCSGGALSSLFTGVPGVSANFTAGLITYSNQSKINLLGVPESLIERRGAVSAEVAEEMARGVLRAAQADYCLAVTGIAGPEGGTAEKPTGTVYIAWGETENIKVRKLLIKRERVDFQRLVAITALDLLRRYLLKLPDDIPYFFDGLTRKNF